MKKEDVSIFVIEDDKLLSAMVRNTIRQKFPEKNLQIYTFETGEFCEPFLENKPDIAIVDYHLDSKYKSAKNGVEIIDKLKQKSPETDIIFMTGDDNISLPVEAFSAGAMTCLSKNESLLEKVNLRIEHYLRLRESTKELTEVNWKSAAMVGLAIFALACLLIIKLMQ